MSAVQLPLLAAYEVSPASDYCQRWSGRGHTWRHRSDGGFDPDGFTVAPVGRGEARNYVVANHYSGACSQIQLACGLFAGAELVGVAILGYPQSQRVLTKTFPDLEPGVESLDLGRFVLADQVPANGETWFLARCFDLAQGEGIRGVVAFADPVPRRLGDRLIFPGHRGAIYQAKGAVYTGRTDPDNKIILPDSTVLDRRNCSKVTADDKGHEYVEARLERLGARRRRPGQTGTAWLAQALDDVGAVRLAHGGNHRYAFALGPNPRVRARVAIAGCRQPYPKGAVDLMPSR